MHFAWRIVAANWSRPLSVRLLIVSSVAAVIGFSAVCTRVLVPNRSLTKGFVSHDSYSFFWHQQLNRLDDSIDVVVGTAA